MTDQLARFGGWFQEWLATIPGRQYEAVHKYFGYELPYRWEIQSDEPGWCTTIALSASDIMVLSGKDEAGQREFLYPRLRQWLPDLDPAPQRGTE